MRHIRRSLLARVVVALSALWSAGAATLQSSQACPMHDAGAFALVLSVQHGAGAMSHGSVHRAATAPATGHHQSSGGAERHTHHACSCMGCCRGAASGAALGSAIVRVGDATCRSFVPARFGDWQPSFRSGDRLLPFANGPPAARTLA